MLLFGTGCKMIVIVKGFKLGRVSTAETQDYIGETHPFVSVQWSGDEKRSLYDALALANPSMARPRGTKAPLHERIVHS